jgi:hypothetical protein
MRRRNALPVFQSWAHLFLAYGYLELSRIDRAWLHAVKAVNLAETTGELSAIKSSMFLLGEVERVGGDSAASVYWFRRMQERFFPDHSKLPAVLSVVGMTRVVNLRA